MVRVRSPGDPRLATPSRRTALPVYLDAISAPRRGALLGLFSDLSLASVDTARYALSAHAGAWGAGEGARFSGVRPLRIQGLRTAEESRDYRGICVEHRLIEQRDCVVVCVSFSKHDSQDEHLTLITCNGPQRAAIRPVARNGPQHAATKKRSQRYANGSFETLKWLAGIEHS